MRYFYLVLIVLLIQVTDVCYAQVNPYPDGTVIAVGSTINETWSITEGTKVTTAGDLSIIASGTIQGTLEVFGDLTCDFELFEGLNISSTGMLVVHGELDWRGDKIFGSYADAGTIDGVVIVDGTTHLAGVSISDNGVVSSGGDLTIDKGWTDTMTGIVSSEDGTVTIIGNPNWAPVTEDEVLTLEELIEAIEDREDFGDIIQNIDGSSLPGSDWEGDVVGSQTDWSVAANWADGEVPGKASNVTIPAIPTGGSNFPNLCGDGIYFMWNLELEDNAHMTIPAGSQVTVFGDIFIGDNAQLTVANSNSNPTSFIIYGDVFKSDGVTPGEITFDWTYNNGNWWFIGHPISNADMSTSYDKIPLLNGGANDYVLYDLEDTDVFTKISKTNFDFSAQSPVKGYLFKVKDDVTPLSLTGYINNDAEYTKTLQNEWQIVANPYPAYYQLPLEDPTDTDADFYHTTGTVYVTNSTSNSDKVFYTYNTLTGISSPANEIVNGIIAPGQGFYIKTNTPGNIRMRASNRVHAVGTLLKAGGAAAEQNVLRLTLQNESGAKDEAVIAFRENGLTSYSRLDSEKKLTSGSAVSSIYSIKEGLITVMNILPTGIEASIPLGVSAQSGRHQISIIGIQTIDDSYEVVLEDLQTGISTLMDGTSPYECELESGENNERFILHLKKQSVATDVDEPMLVEDAEIYVKNGQELVITCNWDSKVKIISVYSVNGSEVMQEMMNGNTYETLLDLPTGIYIVRLSGIEGVFQKKIMIQ